MLPNPRPLGITINGWLYLIGGVLGVVSSFVLLVAIGAASAQLGGMAAVLGIVAFFVALAFAGLYIWIGNGLLNGKRSARTWALVLGGLSLAGGALPLLRGSAIEPLLVIPFAIGLAIYAPLVLNGDFFDD